jgi:heat shock protein HtpX
VWEQIRSNKRRSLFVLAMMGVLLVAVGMSVGTIFRADTTGMFFGGAAALAIWFFLWIVTVSNGDDIMMSMAKARQIEKKDHPILFNVVEEMTIAAGLPAMPRVFIVDDPSPNAFAAGRDPKKAAVAVTTGLLRILDRDELQGVIAHEIGHIKNRDVALVTTAGIMIGAIVMLAEVGLRAMWYSGGGMRQSRTSDDKGGGQAIIMIVALLLMILAPILAQLIYFALSRKREYLADASGALFSRYPEGLASALEKISGTSRPLSDTSKVTAPMYIVRPLRDDERRDVNSAFSTHPPVATRVRVLRSMAGGAGYGAYDAAFRKVTGKRAVGTHTLEEATAVSARTESPDEGPTTTTARRRAASDAFIAASGYAARTCTKCGAKAKIPPSLAGRVKVCPRCHGPLAG